MKKIFLMTSLLILMQFISVFPQSSISYVKSGEGKPIILLPGLGCKSSIWDATSKQLSKNHLCYEISVKGFAGVPPDGQFSIDRIANDVTDVIKREKLDHPVIIGHSLGGFIAMKIAADNPGAFSKLIIIDSFPFALSSFNPSVTVQQAAQQGKMLKEMLLKQDSISYEKSELAILQNLITDKKDIDTVLRWMLSSNRDAIAEATCEMISTDLRDNLKNIDCPSLIIGTWKGKEPLIIDKNTAIKMFAKQYENLKNKTITVSDNSRHFIMLDEPEWLNSQITRFISE